MSRVFVISDLHLGHVKVALDRGFKDVAQHDYALVEAWNRVVTKRDVVYVLGDVFRLDLVPDLKGTKKLAMGNHDQQPVARYAALFSQVRACFEFDGCLLTHIPVNPNQFGRYELNVHGHTHRHKLEDLRYVPVAVEHCERMEPWLLCDLIQARRQRIKDGPPECVLFAREAKKRFGVVGEWEDFRAPDDGALFFNTKAPAPRVVEINRQLYDLAYELFPDGYGFCISVRAEPGTEIPPELLRDDAQQGEGTR
jgi:calcineurin-like phosphoesterase family protein